MHLRPLTVAAVLVAAGVALGAVLVLVGRNGDHAILTAIVTSPRSIVFREAGGTASLGVVGIYSDRSERLVTDQSGLAPAFRSSDPRVATVDSGGQVAAIAPGGTDIFAEYAGFSTAATVIVYAPFVEIPPYDPQLVVQPEQGSAFVLNRVLVKPIGDAYDGALARAIAADHAASLLAEWTNLTAFLLEFDVSTIAELAVALTALENDSRVAAYQLEHLHSPSNSHGGTAAAPFGSNLQLAWAQLRALSPGHLKDVHIAVIDFNLSLQHNDPERQAVIDAEFSLASVNEVTARQAIDGFSHGLAVASIIAGNGAVPGVVSGAQVVPYTLHLYSYNAPNTDSELIPDSGIASSINHISDYARHMDVVNLSLGTKCNDQGLAQSLLDEVRGYLLDNVELIIPDFLRFILGTISDIQDRLRPLLGTISDLRDFVLDRPEVQAALVLRYGFPLLIC